MKPSQKSYIRLLKIISGSASQSCPGLILLFATMLVMYVGKVVLKDIYVHYKSEGCVIFAKKSKCCSILFLLLSCQVTYQTEFFLDKNKDYVVPEHQATLTASRCHFVSGLFPPLPEESSKQTKFSSIGARFKVYFLLSFDRPVFISLFHASEIYYPVPGIATIASIA